MLSNKAEGWHNYSIRDEEIERGISEISIDNEYHKEIETRKKNIHELASELEKILHLLLTKKIFCCTLTLYLKFIYALYIFFLIKGKANYLFEAHALSFIFEAFVVKPNRLMWILRLAMPGTSTNMWSEKHWFFFVKNHKKWKSNYRILQCRSKFAYIIYTLVFFCWFFFK